MLIKNFAKSVAALGSTRFVEFCAGLVRIRLNASFLGVSGIGIVDQLTFFAQQAATFSLSSMEDGLVKQIAQNDDKEDVYKTINSLLKIYVLMTLSMMSICLSILIFFRQYFVLWIFDGSEFLNYTSLIFIYVVGLVCVPILVLNSIPYALMRAFKGTIYIAKARLITVLINLVIFLPLIFLYDLAGVILYVLIGYLVTLSINFFFAYKHYFSEYGISINGILRSKIYLSKGYELATFSVFGLSVGTLLIATEIAIRALIIDRLGIYSVGLYSPVLMWASIITGFILPAFSTYLYPRFSEAKKPEDISILINDGLRLASISILPLLALGISLREYIIFVFYGSDFLEASKYVPYHFIGVLFYAWWFVVSQSFSSTGRIKQHGFFLALFYICNFLIVFLTIDSLGLYAYVLKYLLPPLLFFLVYLTYSIKSMQVKIFKESILTMLYVLLSGLILVALSEYPELNNINFIVGILFLFSVYFILKNDEKEFILNKVNIRP